MTKEKKAELLEAANQARDALADALLCQIDGREEPMLLAGPKSLATYKLSKFRALATPTAIIELLTERE